MGNSWEWRVSCPHYEGSTAAGRGRSASSNGWLRLRKHDGVDGRVGALLRDLGIAHPGQQRDVEDLLDEFFEAEKSDNLAALWVDGPDAAEPLVEALHQRQPAERRRLPHLGEAHEGEAAREQQAEGEAGQFRDGLDRSRIEVRTEIVPLPDSSTQRRPSNQRGVWGIERPVSTVSPLSISIRIPPPALFSLHPPGVSVCPRAVS